MAVEAVSMVAGLHDLAQVVLGSAYMNDCLRHGEECLAGVRRFDQTERVQGSQEHPDQQRWSLRYGTLVTVDRRLEIILLGISMHYPLWETERRVPSRRNNCRLKTSATRPWICALGGEWRVTRTVRPMKSAAIAEMPLHS